jgi:cell division protein FtsB
MNKKYVYWRQWALKGLVSVLLVYFIYHLFQGERGLLSMLALKAQLKKDEVILAEKEQKKATLDHQVHLLRPDSLDLDMLEERARIVLHYANPDELVVR